MVAARQSGSGLDVAQAIGRYLDRANGDTRLALAFSVADGLAFSRMISANASLPQRETPRTNSPQRPFEGARITNS